MFKQALKAITSVFVIFILCVVSYKIGVYSDRIPKAKDIPKYLMNFPKYREFLKIIGSKELLPPLSAAK